MNVVEGASISLVILMAYFLMPPSWNYIGHDPQEFRHYGPRAQEFFAAFGQDEVGTIGTPTTINSGDGGDSHDRSPGFGETEQGTPIGERVA